MKITPNSKKTIIAMALVVAGLFMFQGNSMADGPVLSHTGIINVTSPDGKVSVINPTDALPSIASGSKIELPGGSIEIAPTEGFVQLVTGGSVVTVKAGDKVTVAFDSVTGKADFNVQSGQISVVSGNTTTAIGAGQHAVSILDKAAGITTVESIAGSIETETVGVKATIPQGAIGKISANSKTRNIHIENASK